MLSVPQSFLLTCAKDGGSSRVAIHGTVSNTAWWALQLFTKIASIIQNTYFDSKLPFELNATLSDSSMFISSPGFCIGVLPDVICLIFVMGKTQSVPCCLEIKSRLADTAVCTAEASAMKHGLVINGVFDDDTFRYCVPAATGAQVLHQALVTQFDYGLFVTSKVKGGEGSLVQVVVIAT
ncbi:hypothetical protein IV203_000357 [Nitzschia inconspicua]|uniref:Uncharacterized protein n=1 Tax=Nitzschia inconspicua TaxID=303405 RepID=A0A9K3L6E2_9STRA|nr:hypothetical protein IV203_000357 [Nitzschia inconspicua]